MDTRRFVSARVWVLALALSLIFSGAPAASAQSPGESELIRILLGVRTASAQVDINNATQAELETL